MRTWFPIVSTGLAVFFLVMWLANSCDKPQTKPQDSELWREKVAMREAVIREKDSIIATLQSIRTTQKVRYTSDSLRLERKATEIFKRYREAKQDIAELRDSIPAVDRFVHASDSLLSVKDSTIAVERNHRLADELSYKSEIAALGQKYVQQVAISDEYLARVEQLTNQNNRLEKRLERKKRGNKLLGGVALGLGAALGVVILSQ